MPLTDRSQYFADLFNFIQADIAKHPECRTRVEHYAKVGGIPPAKTGGNRKYEEICTYLYVAPAIARFHRTQQFLKESGLSPDDVKTGLAYEGWKNVDHADDFGSSPVVDQSFSAPFRKGLGQWKGSWSKAQSTPAGRLRNHSPCPDLAFKHPLPFTAVGDCKFLRDPEAEPLSDDRIIDSLYRSMREAFDYYALINIGRPSPYYEAAFLLVVDATVQNRMTNALRTHAHEDLWERLHGIDGFYLGIIRI